MGERNTVEGLFAIAEGLQAVARALDRLGVNDAGTSMGAVEFLAKEVKVGLAGVCEAIEDLDPDMAATKAAFAQDARRA